MRRNTPGTIAVRAVTAAQLRINGWQHTLARRTATHSDRGQTSVEYLGIIAVVVLIVAAILGTNIGTTIYRAITTEIAKVAK